MASPASAASPSLAGTTGIQQLTTEIPVQLKEFFTSIHLPAFMGLVLSREERHKYVLMSRIFLSFLFDQSLLDSQGDWV